LLQRERLEVAPLLEQLGQAGHLGLARGHLRPRLVARVALILQLLLRRGEALLQRIHLGLGEAQQLGLLVVRVQRVRDHAGAALEQPDAGRRRQGERCHRRVRLHVLPPGTAGLDFVT